MPKTRKPNLLLTVLIASLLLNTLGGFVLSRRLLTKNNTAAYVPPPKLPYYMGRDELFASLPPDSNAIVFLGNSLTQYYELAEFFPGLPVKNRGIHGDMMDKVLLRLPPIIASKPKKIFIELGVNDIEQQVPVPRFLALYGRLLDTLRTTCPRTELYVQSLLPVSDSSIYLPASYCSPAMNKAIVAVNRELEKLAAAQGCFFIHLYDSFARKGQLNPQYTVDGVHLSGEGYRVWTRLLKPYLASGEKGSAGRLASISSKEDAPVDDVATR